MTEAQYEYETTEVLRELLRRASHSETVRRGGSGNYSQLAVDQLDALQARTGARQFEPVLESCHLVVALPAEACVLSDDITTEGGTLHRLRVPGDPPHKVFWTSLNADGPRIEAIFSHAFGPRSEPCCAESPASGPSAAGTSAADGDVTDADWGRLRDELLTKHPHCPQCGGEWDFEFAVEEDEGEVDGRRAISITVDCSAAIDDEDDSGSPIHSGEGGWIQHLMYVDG
ncbi:MAG: hypothetical protein M3N95_09260 [Actinomycetota bacterium]|nr:hypothetical protein [Actinomycetota bacterium]